MTAPDKESPNSADLRGPGDPDEVAARPQADPAAQPDAVTQHSGTAANIREEQQTQAAGTVPASYIGSGDPGAEHKPEEAIDEPGNWDGEV